MRVLSYNIHKGFSFGNARFVLARIKEALARVQPDLVLLQEVVGQHSGHAERVERWPASSQFEFLADQFWPHFAYGQNAVYAEGHHGNAILSKYPILSWENQDVSLSKLERRGILHAQVQVPGLAQPAHAICTHLGLFERDRATQLARLCARIRVMVPDQAPLVIGGDFNDWRGLSSRYLGAELGMHEAFVAKSGGHARTFPSWLPLLCLDRLYYRGFVCAEASVPHGSGWSRLSDHLPIVAELQ